jgi:hypothetical protein
MKHLVEHNGCWMIDYTGDAEEPRIRKLFRFDYGEKTQLPTAWLTSSPRQYVIAHLAQLGTVVE